MARPRFRWDWAPVLILVLAAFARGAALQSEGLWCDEAYTAETAQLPLHQMFDLLLHTDDAPPLFYLLEKVGIALGGHSETGLRWIPAMLGCLTVAAALWLYRSEPSNRSTQRQWSAAFLAIAAYGVFHARQARSYALLLFLGVVFVIASRELLLGRRRRGWLLTLSGTLLCLTHHVAILLALSSLILWPLGPRTRPGFGRWLVWHLPALLTFTAFLVGAPAQLQVQIELNQWIQHYWREHHLALAPLYSVRLFIPGALPESDPGLSFATPGPIPVAWTAVAVLCGILCCFSAIVSGGRCKSETVVTPDSAQAPAGVQVSRDGLIEAAFVVLPLALLALATAVATPVYVLGRTDVLGYPGFVLLVGRGLASLDRWPSRSARSDTHRLHGAPHPPVSRRPAPALLMILFWAGISFQSLAPSYGLGHPERAKGADRALARSLDAEGIADGDWVVHTFMTSPTIEYYLKSPHHTAWFPAIARQNTASEFATPPDSLDAYLAEAFALRRRLEAGLAPGGSVWIFGLLEPAAGSSMKTTPPPRHLAVEQIAYPTSLLLYALVGCNPVSPVFLYHQDWVTGDRVVVRVRHRDFAPVDSIPNGNIQVRGISEM